MADFTEALRGVIQEQKDKEEEGSSSWVGALVVSILVILFTAIMGFVAWRRGREMARLKHERAKAEEEAHQARVAADLAEDATEQADALDQAEQLMGRVEELKRERRRLEEEHAAAMDQLKEVTSWDDIDRYMGRRR